MKRAFVLVAFAALVATPGCGGSSSSSGSATNAAATDTPSPAASAYATSHRGRHHRRRHRDVDDEVTPTDGTAGTVASAGTVKAAPSGGTWPCNNQQFLTDQQQFATGALQGDQEVDVCGTVTNVLPSKTTRSGLHGYYDLQVAPGTTIEIVSDLGEMDAPAWPWVKPGDYSYVQGRYYYDSATTQGIDWTHHGTSRSWSSPGYVVVGGTQYQ